MKRVLFIIVSAVCILFYSCEKEETYNSERLVVEGWIESGDNPVILITKTLSLNQDFWYNGELNQLVALWAKVFIDDGDTCVRLLNRIDRNYYPPFYYTTPDIIGKPGKTYKLTIEYQGLIVTAETTIPQPIPLDSIVYNQLPGSDSLFEINAYFKDVENEHNYCGFYTRIKNRETRYYPSILGLFDDRDYSNPDNVSVKVFPGLYKIPQNKYKNCYSLSDTVAVKFSQMDSVSYAVMKSYLDLVNMSEMALFPETDNMKTNINGGLGYWCGFGCRRYELIMR